MNSNLVIGALATLYGVVTLVMRFVAPQSTLFAKLEPMRARLGRPVGTALHWFAYTLVPLGAGVRLLWAALAP